MNNEKYIHVYLKLNDGLWTRKVQVPYTALGGEYRVPLKTALSMNGINKSQPLLGDLKTIPVLVFKATGEMQQKIPVLELFNVENF